MKMFLQSEKDKKLVEETYKNSGCQWMIRMNEENDTIAVIKVLHHFWLNALVVSRYVVGLGARQESYLLVCS